jgi:hypothetical protein
VYKLHTQTSIPPRLVLWIQSFLSSRQIRVVQSGRTSRWHSITAGVPQGSVLAPLLFLIFINDLVSHKHADTKLCLLADDVVLWSCIKGSVRYSDRYNSLQTSLSGCDEWAVKWKMKWSSDKSNIVCFCKAKKHPTVIPTFHLGSIELKQVEHYTYLGLILQSNGKWNLHFNSIKQKAAYSSYLITRVIQRHGPPTPATIRQLTIAIPRARLIWALPFWQPNKSQYEAMDRILTLPLRSVLHLPRCTSRSALFVEYGLANMQLTREYQLLSYATRLLSYNTNSDIFNPAHSLLEASYSRTGRSKQLHSIPFWQQLTQLQSNWHVDLRTTNGLQLKQQMIQRQLQLYQQTTPSTSSPGLRPYKCERGVSLYLYLDPKPVAAMRAKLRFDLASLAGSVIGHRMNTASQACILCDDPASDHREHLLLYCPAFDSKRTELILNLMSDGEDHYINSDSALLQFLLGNIQSNNRQSQQSRHTLQQSARFIQSVYTSRFRSRFINRSQ